MVEERWHPVFGRLTDPVDIAIFDRQQEKDEYEKAYARYADLEYEKAMQEEYERQCELEARLFEHLVPIIKENPNWTAEEVAREGKCSVGEAEHVLRNIRSYGD